MVTVQQHRIYVVIGLVRIPYVWRTDLFRVSAALRNGYSFWVVGILIPLLSGYKS